MTIFRGKKYLVFEKYSDYQSGGRYPSFKVKTLINLGFTKLVLRVRASGYTKKAIEAARLTFPCIGSRLAEKIIDEKDYSLDDFCPIGNKGAKDNVFVRLYCYNYAGELMGALEEFQHWFKYDIVCFRGCPRGVLYARKLDKYLGFSHRGVQAFGIGDRLFDQTWEPTWDDLNIAWVINYCQSVGYVKIPNSIEDAKKFVKLKDIKSGETIVSFIPFAARGSKIIASKDEAIQAARNFSLYLS